MGLEPSTLRERALVRRPQTLKLKVEVALWAVLLLWRWINELWARRKSKMGRSETCRCVLGITCNKPMRVPPAIPFKDFFRASALDFGQVDTSTDNCLCQENMCLLYGFCRGIDWKVEFTAVSAVTRDFKTIICFGRLEYTLLEFIIVIIII